MLEGMILLVPQDPENPLPTLLTRAIRNEFTE
jgi:hypothetical protein